MATAYRPKAKILSVANDQDVAAIKCKLFGGDQVGAVELVKTLIATRQFSPILHYWLAAAHGACGDQPAYHDALNQAQAFQSLEIIRDNGGDLARLQKDGDYALSVAQRCVEAGVLGPAMTAYGRLAIGADVTGPVLAAYSQTVFNLGRAQEAQAAMTVASEVFNHQPAKTALLAQMPYGRDGISEFAAAAKVWGDDNSVLCQAGPGPALPNPPRRGRRLRVGYLVHDLFNGAMQQTVFPALKAHDPSICEITVYTDIATCTTDAKLNLGAATIVGIADLTDAAVFDLIRAANIDVLVDLSGHLNAGRLGVMTSKAAPVQVSWTASALTTGLSTIDYLLAASGGGQPQLQAETVWPLGAIQTPYVHSMLADTDCPAGLNLELRFSALVHPADLDALTLGLWAGALQACPTASLVFFHPSFADPVIQNTACAQFAAQGLDPDRLVFGGGAGPDYDYSQVHLVLAPAGGVSISGHEVLRAAAHGCPTLCLAPLEAGAPNPMAALGWTSALAVDAQDYAAKAAFLSADPASWNTRRDALVAAFQASPYANVAAFTARLELAYGLMFDIWSQTRTERQQGRLWRTPERHILRRRA